MIQVLDNGVLRDATEEEQDEILARQEQGAQPVVPSTVTNGQAKEALLNAGMYDDVAPAIAAIEDGDMRRRAEIAWEYRPTVERNSPFVMLMAQALQLSDAQLDQLFIDAAKL